MTSFFGLLEGILIFFLFLGPLVFFHELGHFLFARLMGVRVEVFSIGFGPKIFSFKKGDTQYALSLIPLGGYVKMFGDDPLSEEKLSEEEEKVAFTKKGKWARFWIVFGGPLVNFILAFFIYWGLIVSGEKVPPAQLGVINESSKLYEMGFRTGDIVSKIDDFDVISFDDLSITKSSIDTVIVKRNGKAENISVGSPSEDFLKELFNFNSFLRAPIVTNSKGEKYLIELANDTNSYSLDEIFEMKSGNLVLTRIQDGYATRFDREKITLASESINLEIRDQKVFSLLKDNGFFPRDLYITNIRKDSAAAEENLKMGDIILSIDGNSIENFSQLKETIQNSKGEKTLDFGILQNGEIVSVKLQPRKIESQGQVFYGIGVESGISFFTQMVEVKTTGFFESFSKAIDRTVDGTVKTVKGLFMLITGQVSIKNVGGPIAIGQAATNSLEISLSMFFRLMAIISINLGVINLFPVPVLDGGHIVFIFLELLNGGPLSRKKMQYAQQFGLSILFMLIFVALFNDITRLF